MKKSEHMPVWLRKLVFLLHVCSVSWGGWYKRAAKVVHLLEKSVINMMWLLVPVFDWWLIMIGPGGLLLVVPICLQSPFQFNGWGCKKVGNYTWMWKIVFWRVAYSVSTGGDAHSLSICGTLVLELVVQVWAEESKGLGEGDGLG